ncbi:MAG: universal stress protein [Deltaproteobacteria bacterium]
MIDKIVWTSDGSRDSLDALNYAVNLARIFGSEIVGLYVIPDYFEVPTLDEFPSTELDLLASWIKEKESKGSDRLKSIAEDLSSRGIKFSTRITQGVPYLKIIETAEELNADLIVMGKGRAEEKNILGATALKVIRRSRIPVLVAKMDKSKAEIKRILIPSDIYNIRSRDLELALDFSKDMGAELFSLNVVVTGEGKYPPEVIERMRGNAYDKLTQTLDDEGLGKLIEPVVTTSKNAWMGIVDFVKEKDVDLIFMNSYQGGKFRREEFIGSVAERVVQEASCPVITVKPL